MKTKNYNSLIIVLFLVSVNFSCKKNALDIKPDQALVVPSTLQDFQGMLDNEDNINVNQPALGELGSNDDSLAYNYFQALSNPFERNSYTWAKDIFQGQSAYDWYYAYQVVFYSNVVLDGLQKIKTTALNQSDYNNIKGQALFLRSFAFFEIAQEFAKPYIGSTANSDLGIPLRLSSDINQKSVRATVAQTYQQITSDLKEASNLLPVTPFYKTRASKPAAFGLLARVYLSMSDFQNAYANADASLQLYNTLIDYNSLNLTASHPLKLLNDEVTFHQTMGLYLTFIRMYINPNLYASYAPNDLRLAAFFNVKPGGNHGFKGSYGGSLQLFSGIATDEMYLTRSECLARLGNIDAAMNDLNTLLAKRYATGTFVPATAATTNEALSLILAERHKELIFRGIRWMDLRRLNLDPLYAVTLTKTLNGQTYSLPPNDPRYVYPISDDIITLTGMQQNQR